MPLVLGMLALVAACLQCFFGEKAFLDEYVLAAFFPQTSTGRETSNGAGSVSSLNRLKGHLHLDPLRFSLACALVSSSSEEERITPALPLIALFACAGALGVLVLIPALGPILLLTLT